MDAGKLEEEKIHKMDTFLKAVIAAYEATLDRELSEGEAKALLVGFNAGMTYPREEADSDNQNR